MGCCFRWESTGPCGSELLLAVAVLGLIYGARSPRPFVHIASDGK